MARPPGSGLAAYILGNSHLAIVEVLPFSYPTERKGRGFDRLSPNGSV
jgi:hypothetical protein